MPEHSETPSQPDSDPSSAADAPDAPATPDTESHAAAAGPTATPAPTETSPQTPADGGLGPGNRFGIQIGGKRKPGDAPVKARSEPVAPANLTNPELAMEGPVVPDHPVTAPPKPNRRDPLSAELEAEIDAAFGDMSLDRLVDEAASEKESDQLEVDSRRRASVIRIHGDNVFFSLGGRHQGVASLRQFPEPPEVGAQLEVLITGENREDGLYEVLIPGASIRVGDWSDIAEGALVEARVTGSNTGGLECMVNNIRGFIPASQIDIYRTENMPEYVDQKLVCVVTEVNEQRGNLVLSRRSVLEREKEESKRKLLEELAVGQEREGTVRSLQDFGAFVDLGGVDGLIHISQLSWDRVKHPSEVLKEGQKVKVRIEKIDEQTSKIGLSYRDLLENPWSGVQNDFPAGSVVTGVVTRIATFGAFVKLTAGVEGLVHISEVAHHRVKSVGNLLKEGQEVEVKVLDVDLDNQRISLSIKQTQQSPELAKATAVEEEDETPRELAVPERKGPLKGGLNRPSGGEDIGLNW